MGEAEVMVQLISSVGFPIAACVGLFYLYYKTIQELTITLASMEATLATIKEAMTNLNSRMSTLEDKE